MLATRIARASSSSAATIKSAASGASKLARSKASTDLTGLAVHPSPLTALNETYTQTLKFLDTLPAESVYKQATYAITSDRKSILDQVQQQFSSDLNSAEPEQVENAIKEVELQLDAGQIEEVLVQAQDEFKLAAKMLEWKSHEPLEVSPPAGQWSYFDMAEEASTNE